MSELFNATDEYIPGVEEEQDISSDLWHTNDESDTDSVIAPSDISQISENDIDDENDVDNGSKSHGQNEVSVVGDPTIMPTTLELDYQEIQTDKYIQNCLVPKQCLWHLVVL